jgi:UPF0755 protein
LNQTAPPAPDLPETASATEQSELATVPADTSGKPDQLPEPSAKKQTRKKTRRYLFLTLLTVLWLVAALALAVYLPLPLTENRTVVIPHGATVQAIAVTLQDNGVPVNRYIFRLAARLFADDGLKAGEYQITPEQSLADVVEMMREGRSVVRLLTIPEGLTSHEIVTLLRDDPALSGEIKDIPPEGSLLPETYRYSLNDARSNVIERMRKSMKEQLNGLWEKRESGLPLQSPEEALVMASIIEKETGKKPEERARVAGVFANRLKQGMRLQSDPTVIYALTKGQKPFGRDLRREDLSFASPYNTYMYTGLPPGPISNPGRASLEAALHPEKNDFLYFVADGTGGHAFARDLATHNKNVNNWLGLPASTATPKQKPKP